MRVFMIDNLVYGGAERQAIYLIENNIGFDNLVLLEDYKKYESNASIPIRAIHCKKLKLYQRPLGDRTAINVLSRCLSRKDTVVSFLERSNLVNIKTAAKTGHRAIISVRNYTSERYKNIKYTYRRHLIKKYYHNADLVVANSIESKKDLIKNFNVPEERIKVIYNLIDIDRINLLKEEPLDEKYDHIFQSPVIINVGSLSPQKSHKQLIEAFKFINKENPEYKMVIIGTGKLGNKLEKTILKNNLEKSVFLLGDTNNPFKYLYRSAMFVLNSKYEGFPNVLLESLSVGTPVVSKNCLSGPSEMLEARMYNNEKVIKTKYGFLFPRKTKSIQKKHEKAFLIEAINELIFIRNNDNIRYNILKLNCANRAKDFTIKKIANEWFEILNRSGAEYK